ncbi:DUF4123 domain-containing protein [Enterobacter ludwigii]|uniref:DUF4123 domain-containing protein n=1 Tax=Enterobacter ludwigii TaxID=299767 RepID=UPI003F73078F
MDSLLVPESLNGQWLEQAEFSARSSQLDYIDIVVDPAGSGQPLAESLSHLSPGVHWGSLFEGTPEEGLGDDSPFLVRLYWREWQHKSWINELIRRYGAESRLLLLISPLVFDELKSHLTALSQFLWEEQSGVLRFYDTRIFPELFNHVLTTEQQQCFTRIAYYWSWLDRDLLQIWKRGGIDTDNDNGSLSASEPVHITDKQFDMIGCISDAEIYSRATDSKDLSKEACFQHYLRIVLDASQSNFTGDIKDYIKQSETASHDIKY